jgi:hypothetical protein
MISVAHGWRIRRDPETRAIEARCPPCYKRYRATTSAPPPPPQSQGSLPAAPPSAPSLPVHRVAAVSRFRSTWLCSSLAALRERGHFERYVSFLPPEYQHVVAGTIAGTWLPIEVAVAHYRACDRLELGALEILSIGHDVTNRVHGSALKMVVTLAHGFGVTPWSALSRATSLWKRCWEGGEVSVSELGPKEARVAISGWPCASTNYCRVACRGMLTAIIEPFCSKAFVREEPRLCGAWTLGYAVAWA